MKNKILLILGFLLILPGFAWAKPWGRVFSLS